MKKSKVTTFVERLRQNPRMAALIDKHKAMLSLEIQFEREMERRNESPARFAKKIGANRSTISRDLHGGLSKAKLERVASMANALDCDLVAVILPREARERKARLREVFGLVRSVGRMANTQREARKARRIQR